MPTSHFKIHSPRSRPQVAALIRQPILPCCGRLLVYNIKEVSALLQKLLSVPSICCRDKQ
eukprot:scaffold30529_cov88-Skeletonema_marinoi.AAC.1